MWRLAQTCNLVGWVQNDSSGVTVEIEGLEPDITRFVQSFGHELPSLARVDSFVMEPTRCIGEPAFRIVESVSQAGSSTPISPEISVCEDCLRELNDASNRRYRYPFVNCTNCGPRFTIVEDIPYDRPLTTMKSFIMCAACLAEYQDPTNRRYHAQPNACSACGPRVWFVDRNADELQFETPPHPPAVSGDAAITAFHAAIAKGLVVAVKGLGGFHLACDATNDQAVRTLRTRKGRIDKPLAIMVRSVEDCEPFAKVGEREQALLESRERPIVLLSKREPPGVASQRTVSHLLAPGNNFIGVVFPYSPLHYLLMEGGTPLVMTSGNRTDEPIARANREAKDRLTDLADHFLLHDRDIHVVCDDSVVRCTDEGMLPIRRSRGYSPTPVKLPYAGPSVLAVGGEVKATFCITKGDDAYLSQHIGDLEHLETVVAMRRSVEHFVRVFRVRPQAIAADLHPDYLSTQLAIEFAKKYKVPLLQVQHHHAHLASIMAELALPDHEPMLGIIFDGTGYGPDGAIWGGEFLLARDGDFTRVAQLANVALPGGNASVRHPYRAALAHLFAAKLPWHAELSCVRASQEAELRVLRQQLERNIHCVPTSSMGRLFDAAASLIGVRHSVSYEGQAAMELEAVAARAIDHPQFDRGYTFEIRHHTVGQIDVRTLLSEMCNDVLAGVEPEIIAARFHRSVARMAVDTLWPLGVNGT